MEIMKSCSSFVTYFCAFIVKVNMIKDDGEVIHFNNPKVQASLAANTFAVSGHAEIKRQYFILLPWCNRGLLVSCMDAAVFTSTDISIVLFLHFICWAQTEVTVKKQLSQPLLR